ncbi:MAG: hypothetical protein ACI4MQ_01790 [Candidatus Coproplasma sp.]
MQLAILIAILLLSGQNSFSQIKPIIEEFGGEEAKSAIKQAEELNQIISAVQTLASSQADSGEQPQDSERQSSDSQPITAEQTEKNSHPLDPVKSIADDKILSALSRYVALGE